MKVAICSDHPVTPSGHLRLYALLAVREGMAHRDALSAMTIWPAQISGVANRIGSLASGLDADFTIYSGDPLDAGSVVIGAYQNGVKVPMEARS